MARPSSPASASMLSSILLEEQERERKPKKPQGMTAEQLLRLAGGAAPIVGGLAGTLAGPGGSVVGGGVGSLVGAGANMAADHMERERVEDEIEDEEEAMRELAKKQRLAAFL